VNRLFILDMVVDVVVRTALVFSLFMLFAGHNLPGGGFIAGLIGGICLILRYISRGAESMRRLIRARPEQLLGSGLFVAILAGAGGLIWGEGFLDANSADFVLPLLGDVKVTSALVFDIGVYLVVVGLAASLLVALGDDTEEAS
jgi:multicomponent Na+:H+ antiporter subunit A